ncbi:oxygen-independent coproporphyrinogen III oxidase [Duganella sp. Leaf126]|uniref:oxygen-independent coproporphyrinogen III oxidase n=1 Tax=Duganella sp. Leaf126 TaxID=1736266 RepID=UPI000B2DE948|nr:oxygen-independent coproporphyrinogen III oxidase [Duganella sp. Leaf126]
MSAASSTASAVDAIEFDATIIAKLSQSGPRYTSYPTADRFASDFGYGQFLEAVAGLRLRRSPRPLSLYIHVPFCDTICYYCGCNKIVTRDRSKAATYLGYLKQELDMQGRLFAGIGQVEQLHFGGGTPTYLNDRQMGDLIDHLHRNFDFAPDALGEYAIEIDPRTVTPARIGVLRAQGFNRISLGVQDFEPDVQQAVNRIQPEADTRAVMDAARDAGFRSISIDLIYGLPRQSIDSMARTLDKVIAASPDRIALYNYAHLPHLFKPQRRIAAAELPSAAVKLELLALCIGRLCAAGYVYIGMDHFAKPGDELAVAQRQGRLQRNFQGYSTRAEADLIACGVSAISAIGATYSQNEKTLDAYYEKLDAGVLPVTRGVRLDHDDLLRRLVIQRLMCHFELSVAALEQAFPITFSHYFAAELERLQTFVDDGLLTIDRQWLSVTPRGRLVIRNICMVFDRYLATAHPDGARPLRYSTTI